MFSHVLPGHVQKLNGGLEEGVDGFALLDVMGSVTATLELLKIIKPKFSERGVGGKVEDVFSAAQEVENAWGPFHEHTADFWQLGKFCSAPFVSYAEYLLSIAPPCACCKVALFIVNYASMIVVIWHLVVLYLLHLIRAMPMPACKSVCSLSA
jgi:hypothetical protein